MTQLPQDPYTGLPSEQLILRDHLAADRTVLANERTFLAYARTALALVVAGISLVRFFGHEVTDVLGWVLIPLGLLTLAVGTRAYFRMRRKIAALDDEVPSQTPERE